MNGKKIRNIIICAAVWFVVVAAVSVVVVITGMNQGGLRDENEYAESEKDYFITDNTAKSGLIRQMQKDGKVLGIFTTAKFGYLKGWHVTEVEYYDENLYALFFRDRDDAGREIREYALATLNDEMQITNITNPFRLPLENMRVTGLFATDNTVYISAVPEDGLSAYVYSVKTASLSAIKDSAPSKDEVYKWEALKTEVREEYLQGTVEGRIINAVEYREGVFNIRYDSDAPGVFELDNEIRTIYANRKESLRLKLRANDFSIAVAMIVWFVGVLIIIALFFLLPGRIRMVYSFLTVEAVLLICLLVAGAVMVTINQNTAEREYQRYEQQALYSAMDGYTEGEIESANLYDSEWYALAQDRLYRHKASVEGVTILNSMIIDKGRMVRISADGSNNEALEDLYGRDMVELIRKVNENGRVTSKRYMVGGKKIHVLVVPLKMVNASDYLGVSVAEADTLSVYSSLEFWDIVRLLIIIYALSSIAAFLYSLILNKDIRDLQTALGLMAAGSEDDIEKPKVLGKDMDYMWNSIYEIQKNVLKTNRIKYLTYEAYYRFAPKNVERILGKNSITEVASKDAVSLNGTVAIISMEGQKDVSSRSIERINNYLSYVEESRKEYDGTFVSQNSDLSSMELLFMDDNRTASDFGRSLINRIRAGEDSELPDATVLVHYSPFIYGVAGTVEQSSVYLSAPEADALSRYTRWFHSLHICLVLTAVVVEREHVEGELRHIGFVIPDKLHPENRIQLYEMLDAESAPVRIAKIRNRARFNEALNLFYEQDFYLARNTFTEILRDVPEDELSKWYLFECERMLNDNSGSTFYGELHKENNR